MVSALSTAVTIPGAILAACGGGVLMLLGPVFAARLRHAADPQSSRATPWMALLLCEALAAVLLFMAGKAFGVIPPLATPVKIGIIICAALGLSGVGALVPSVRRGPA